jgi:hypothetical protein
VNLDDRSQRAGERCTAAETDAAESSFRFALKLGAVNVEVKASLFRCLAHQRAQLSIALEATGPAVCQLDAGSG